MAEQGSERTKFPQIPSTVWWGVRAVLNRSPNAVIDERLLGIELGVQEIAAKQYLAELVAVGILSDEKRATPLALKWRLEEKYPEAVGELLTKNYPSGLLEVAPPGTGERQKAVSWFKHEGLGEGAAKNKASTYFLMGSPSPSDAPTRGSALSTSDTANRRAPRPAKSNGREKVSRVKSQQGTQVPQNPETIPLNVNVQIHIGADASSEQIEAIFSAMKRYLYDKQAN